MSDSALIGTMAALANTASTESDGLERLLRYHQVQCFYFEEATLLDDRRYPDWLNLFTDDTSYWMPIRRTKTSKDLDQEFTPKGAVAFFDDDRTTLGLRVKKLETGYSWSEDPPSRTRHIITNIQVLTDDGRDLETSSNFLLYRTRLNSEEDSWVGHRKDRLRRVGNGLKIAERQIFLEQTLLLAPNLSSFF